MRLGLLVATALVPLVLWAALPLVSEGATPGHAGRVSHKLDRKRKALERNRDRERVLTTDVSALHRRIGRLQRTIGTLQRRQRAFQADLDRKRAVLVRTQDDLRDQRARLARLRARLQTSRRILAARLIELYESDEPDIVTVILHSDGFAQLLENAEYLDRINEQDARVLGTVRDAKTDATATTHRLAVLERRQQQVAAAILARRNQVATARVALARERARFVRARAARQDLLGRLREKRRGLMDDVAALAKQQAKIRGALQGGGPIHGGGGPWTWPVDGTITSPFCERRAWEACHPGMDIAAPTGTPIHAVDGGRVAIAGPTGGYGNYTCIQHTSSLSSCYGHQSRIDVHVGQSVSQGAVIGAVGSTGFSTGPHLHIEARANGTPTNPLRYLN
jgi:murein DD-endopeptidase MepM/ murein hydrolase activator NlpD